MADTVELGSNAGPHARGRVLGRGDLLIIQDRFRSVMTRLAVLMLMAFAVAAPVAAACDDDERPYPPHSLKATPLGSGGILLQWSTSAGNKEIHYDISIRDKQGRPVPEAPGIAGGATNQNSLQFFNLKPDKEYFFSMRARTERGTQGCVSKNASETVSARTDTAETNAACSNYAKTAMENIQLMDRKLCALPGDTISGIWARSERTQFQFCLQQKRAGQNGHSEAQWSRNQDLQTCNENANRCNAYKRSAVAAASQNRILGCGYTGPRWNFNASDHYNWCMPLSATPRPHWESRARDVELAACRAKRAKGAQPGGNSGGGSGQPPAEWSEMLQVHNDMRGQYCAAPLTWNAELARSAQAYAEECKCGHGNPQGVGENLAARNTIPDEYPASRDAVAFQETWGCESKLYDFKNPKIVPGFKNNCLGPPAGLGVNGHFTQVVWRSTTQLGCGRARCPSVDKDCKPIGGSFETRWVCRYSPGGNDTSLLAQNVQQPPCGQSFRSRPAVTCSGGRVQTASGACVCPPGTIWNARSCVESPRAVPPRTTPPIQPPLPSKAGPIPPQRSECTDGRIGTPPNCVCPPGTHATRSGQCLTNVRPTPPQQPLPSKAGPLPQQRPECTDGRIGTPPNCVCPPGTHATRSGQCLTNARPTQPQQPSPSKAGPIPQQRPECTDGRIGTPPNCVCPPGTHATRSGQCLANARPTPQQQPLPSKAEPEKQCTGGRIGQPPRCHCPAGTQFIGRLCRSIPKPTPTGPTPKKTCSGGKVPRSTDGVCVCPNGTTDRGGQCVDAVR